MTSETELQGLSRAAAGCLPEDWRIGHGMLLGYEHELPKNGGDGNLTPNGTWVGPRGTPIWLHESTEACTEIMVRILMPLRVDLDWVSEECILASQRPNYQGSGPSRIIVPHAIVQGQMLAFRVAVLRALICLKGKS